MSSSNSNGNSRGRIVLGIDSEPLDKKKLHEPVLAWTSDTEEELLARVRSRAREQAKSIIIQAMEEAERIKKQAAEDARRNCEQELRSRKKALQQDHEERFAGMLASLQSGKDELLKAYREDLLALVKLCVEKAVRLELDRRGVESLSSLLDEALELIDSHRQLTITVAPGDAGNMEELLKRSSSVNPDLEKWKIKTSPDLDPGGLLVESSFGMVQNSVSGRMESIRCILEKLSLPGDVS